MGRGCGQVTYLVLVRLGCYNQIPYTGDLKTKICLSQICRLKFETLTPADSFPGL